MKRGSCVLIIFVGFLVIYGIYHFSFLSSFSPGNIPSFTSVKTKCNDDLFYKYTDTFLLKNPTYANPTTITYKEDYDFLKMFPVYFKDDPEEMYVVSIRSSSVRLVYKMKNGRIQYSVENISEQDNVRIEKRLKLVWTEIEKMIEEANLPDSLKYK